MKPYTYIIVGILSAIVSACKTGVKMERYEWSQTLCAPKGYPALIISGGLSNSKPGEKGASFGLWEGTTTNCGWGRSGGGVTNSLKAMPGQSKRKCSKIKNRS